MKSIIFSALMAAAIPSQASTLEWDYPVEEESRITKFVLYENGQEHYVLSNPTARSMDTQTAGLSSGKEYYLKACSEAACSDKSNTLYIPVMPTNIRITIEW